MIFSVQGGGNFLFKKSPFFFTPHPSPGMNSCTPLYPCSSILHYTYSIYLYFRILSFSFSCFLYLWYRVLGKTVFFLQNIATSPLPALTCY